MSGPILVAGASGLLGGAVATKLMAAGHAVRGLSRSLERLAPLAAEGAEVALGDLRDRDSLDRACAGVAQIFSTANSFMGRGAANPKRVDLPGYRNLLAAAEAAGVGRVVHTSAYGITRDDPVDYFRVKVEIDDLILGSGLPYVLLRPAAFLDVWVGMMLADIRAGRPVRLFGNGRTLANYIAVNDVAEFAVRILERPEVTNEVVDVGGPSTASQRDLADAIQSALGRPIGRRHAPLAVLRIGAMAIRPFDELTARFMALGAWAASRDRRLDHWEEAAERFGVRPRAAEAFISAQVAG